MYELNEWARPTFNNSFITSLVHIIIACYLALKFKLGHYIISDLIYCCSNKDRCVPSTV